MKARLVSILLAFLLLSALFSGAAAAEAPFTDVPSDAWYAEGVNWCREKGIISGTSETAFSPDAAMTRAMLAVVFH